MWTFPSIKKDVVYTTPRFIPLTCIRKLAKLNFYYIITQGRAVLNGKKYLFLFKDLRDRTSKFRNVDAKFRSVMPILALFPVAGTAKIFWTAKLFLSSGPLLKKRSLRKKISFFWQPWWIEKWSKPVRLFYVHSCSSPVSKLIFPWSLKKYPLPHSQTKACLLTEKKDLEKYILVYSWSFVPDKPKIKAIRTNEYLSQGDVYH